MNGRNRRRSRSLDLAHRFLVLTLVDCLGFNESFFEFARIGVEGIRDSLKTRGQPSTEVQEFRWKASGWCRGRHNGP
jgi:hypothetical protein